MRRYSFRCMPILILLLLMGCMPDNQGRPKPDPDERHQGALLTMKNGRKKMDREMERLLNRLDSEIHSLKAQLTNEADKGSEKISFLLRKMEQERGLLEDQLKELRSLSDEEFASRQEEFDAYMIKVGRKVESLLEEARKEMSVIEKSGILNFLRL